MEPKSIFGNLGTIDVNTGLQIDTATVFKAAVIIAAVSILTYLILKQK